MLNKRFSAILFGATIMMTTFTVKAPSAQAKPWRAIGRQIQRRISKPTVRPRSRIPNVNGAVKKVQPYLDAGSNAAGIAGGVSTTYCRLKPCQGNNVNIRNQNQPQPQYQPQYTPGGYYRY